jgi:hypothetical protein
MHSTVYRKGFVAKFDFRADLKTVDFAKCPSIGPFSQNKLFVFCFTSKLRNKTYGQGRVLVFNKNGIPIGQVLLPGGDDGHNLQSTSMALQPDTNDLYIVTNDGNGGQGATIFHAKVFAKALPLYSHQ